jgi:LmbE family N-acetylglucosaminyl deacetylase
MFKALCMFIDISDYLAVKIRAVAAHRSQQDAREFVEMLQQDKDSGTMAMKYFYQAKPGSTQKEKAFLHNKPSSP